MIKNIKDNLDLIVKKQEELDDKNKTIDELRKSLYFKTVKMRVIPFDHPKLVCEHVDCTEFLEVSIQQKINTYLVGIPHAQ